MLSAHYKKMVKDLATVRKITRGVPATSCETVMQELKIKSFIMMSHAVIEEYLEALTLDTAEKALQLYTSDKVICRALVGLISCGLIARVEEAGISRKLKKEVFENIELFSGSAFGRFKSLVGENNGIKIKDQEKLFYPVGVDPAMEDPATMAALDGFGGKRGSIAHNFKIAKTHTLSEINGDIENIKMGLVNFDVACTKTLTKELAV